MKRVRWILFIPVAAVCAYAAGELWAQIFSRAYISHSGILSFVSGVYPLFFGRLIPVFVFIFLGTILVPKRGYVQIILLSLLGGVFGWPFGQEYYLGPGMDTFYIVESLGVLCGVAIGIVSAFRLRRNSGNQ
jgi:hypothetical protein